MLISLYYCHPSMLPVASDNTYKTPRYIVQSMPHMCIILMPTCLLHMKLYIIYISISIWYPSTT